VASYSKIPNYHEVAGFLPTRKSLLSRLKDWEDQESWRQFFNLYWNLIYGFALRWGLADAEAQEVVQETIIEVANKMPNFKYDPALGSFKNWLLRITWWRTCDHLRRRQSEERNFVPSSEQMTPNEAIELVPDPASADPDAIWDEEWRRNIMAVAIEQVKHQVRPKQFQLFDLYAVKGWPLEKVTRTMKVTAMQVYLAKHRVAALLKKEVKRLERTMP
jgi:RNA polymerase sigma-70 factor (ECF subfamily)